jgi:TonB family protein
MASAFVNTALVINLLIGPALSAQDTLAAAPAQNATPAPTSIAPKTVSMPKDPAEILSAAAKVNGLVGPGISPWHIRVTYQTFDTKGHAQDSGIYEESWISDTKYKRVYRSSSFTQTDVATERGLYRSGNQNWPGILEMMVRSELIEPIPVVLSVRGIELRNNKRSFGKLKLECVTLTSDTIFPTRNGYCFEQDQPLLRFAASMGDWNNVLYNDLVGFQGHSIARDIRVMDTGHPHLVLHVEEVEGLSTISESDFTPPPDAVRVLGGRITISEETMKGLCVRQISPHYPENAKASRIEGTVLMEITVGKDGHVIDAQVVSGPDGLRKAAVDAVRGWEFRPFLFLGEPAEVESKMRIIFTLGS